MAIFEIPTMIRVEAETIDEAQEEVQSFLAYGNEVGNDTGIIKGYSVGTSPASPVTLPLLDWRIQEGGNAEIPQSLRGEGKLTLSPGSYGPHLDVETPDGRKVLVSMEMDAGAFKIRVFSPTQSCPREDTEDEAVVHLAVKTGGVIVSSGYGQQATLYEPLGQVSSCPLHDGHAILDALQPDGKSVAQLSGSTYQIKCVNGDFWSEDDAPLVFSNLFEVTKAANEFLEYSAKSGLAYAPKDIKVVRNDGSVASFEELLGYSMTDWLLSIQYDQSQGATEAPVHDRYWETLEDRRLTRSKSEDLPF